MSDPLLKRECQAAIRVEEESLPVSYTLTWEDDSKSRFVLEMRWE